MDIYFCGLPIMHIFIFTYKNISMISWEFLYGPLSKIGKSKKNIYIYARFFISYRKFSNNNNGKVIVNVYNHIQRNCPYPSPNTKNIVPQCLVYTAPQVTTGGISASPYYIIQTKLLSRPYITNMLDNSVNNIIISSSFQILFASSDAKVIKNLFQ